MHASSLRRSFCTKLLALLQELFRTARIVGGHCVHSEQAAATETETEADTETPPRENKRPSEEERGQVLALLALLMQKSTNADTCGAGA
jgi:hypothetical protein